MFPEERQETHKKLPDYVYGEEALKFRLEGLTWIDLNYSWSFLRIFFFFRVEGKNLSELWSLHLKSGTILSFATRRNTVTFPLGLIITRTMFQYLALCLSWPPLSPSQNVFPNQPSTMKKYLFLLSSPGFTLVLLFFRAILTSKTSTRVISPIHVLVANGPRWPRREATRSLSSPTPTRRARRARH